MPIFSVTYTYSDDAALADEHRPAHRAYLRFRHEDGALLASGPLAGAGAGPSGALIILDTPTVADAERLLDSDPFVKTGVVVTREIRQWSPVIGVWADRA